VIGAQITGTAEATGWSEASFGADASYEEIVCALGLVRSCLDGYIQSIAKSFGKQEQQVRTDMADAINNPDSGIKDSRQKRSN
jgi:hypothetical protein